MIKKLLLLSLISCTLSAEIKFQDITSKPSGRSKNFMIWQYLRQDITAKEADKAYSLVEGNIYKIKKEYLKKSKNKKLLRERDCRRERDLLSIDEKDCFKMAMSPFKTLHLDDETREKLLAKLETQASRDQVRIQAEPFTENAYIKYNANTILSMFVSTTSKHRRENLNLKLSKKFIHHMFSKNASNWRKFALIKKIVNDDRLDKLQESLLLVKPNDVNDDSNFLLGLNHLRFGSTKIAVKHFKQARSKATKRINQDKNLFWIYQATKNNKYLKNLLTSTDINIYTQYAHDILDTEISHYFHTINVNNERCDSNICDPFEWDAIMKKIQNTPKDHLLKLAKTYKQKEMAPVQSFILEKASSFKKHSFIMPYDKYLGEITTDEKALVYALMRQESNLIPAALSRSFALGLMQIMPFVTDDLSTRMKNPIKSYDDMFQPSYNIRYALKHLEWLNKTFYHPLFTAYAYNGGLGFLRKHLKAKTFRKGKYEPFLSMELMSNRESREYGKRVLSNYVIYKKILGEEVSIVNLLNTLTDPKKTDRYRSKG
ncbi:MAG: soluble lytic murein transglycosylase [Sulfurimonas sp.]|jgi:soluble lytic murein transglycosylase|uniref:lytic transglycosylase domain-containing protein n=1 Tax=Sulfurimonas sp. TaxID=2022749 RepID=UPI0039E30710